MVGQKGFRELLRDKYFEDANDGIGVYDITQINMFNDLRDWTDSMRKVAGDIPMIFAVNKSDLKNSYMFDENDLKDMVLTYTAAIGSKSWNIMITYGYTPYTVTSAKTCENTERMFKTLSSTILLIHT